jgi:3-oxoacyl-[acyl-carrier protein] reductase
MALLDGKHALVYGAGGPVGESVARAFAHEGATVSLAGRSRAKLDDLGRSVRASSGAIADVAEVDALDPTAVREHVDRLTAAVGAVDICFNAVGDETKFGDLVGLPLDEFIRPVTRLVTAQFVIATSVARHMIERGAGVILTMTGSGLPTAGMGGAMTAWAAVDAMCGQLARELGPHGIRVLWLRSNGLKSNGDDPVERERSMLNRLALPEDVGNVAAFLASDRAATMTATAANITAGAEPG